MPKSYDGRTREQRVADAANARENVVPRTVEALLDLAGWMRSDAAILRRVERAIELQGATPAEAAVLERVPLVEDDHLRVALGDGNVLTAIRTPEELARDCSAVELGEMHAAYTERVQWWLGCLLDERSPIPSALRRRGAARAAFFFEQFELVGRKHAIGPVPPGRRERVAAAAGKSRRSLERQLTAEHVERGFPGDVDPRLYRMARLPRPTE